MHREEYDVQTDDRESEVPSRETLRVHPTRHPREPEIEAREDSEHRAAEQDIVQMGDDPVRVLKRVVEGDRRLEHAVDPAYHEHRDEADGEEHRRLELD